MEVRRSREQWSGLVEALLASGQPLGVFASHAGVNAKSLGWWRWRLGSTPGSVPADERDVVNASSNLPGPGAVIELARPRESSTRPTPPHSGLGVRVELGMTTRIAFAELPPPAYLAALVHAYEGGS